MEKQIEAEIRGKIKNFNSVLKKFHERAKFLKEKDRFSLLYFRGGVPYDVSDIKNEKVDLRLRVTNKIAEIVLKYGIWGGSDSRKEISIPIELDKFDDATELLKNLGWDSGVIMTTKTFVFDYKGIEFALVNSKTMDYFEAEKMIKDKKDAEKIMNEIKKICKEFGLEPFTEEEFRREINKINNDPDAKFDFKKQDFKEIKKKYKEFW
jgi:adenylate cyclase class IV